MTWFVTRGAELMVGAEPPQDAGSTQEIMHQSVNNRRLCAESHPIWPIRGEQEARQAHREDLVGHTIDPAHGADQRLVQQAALTMCGSGARDLVVYPGDEVRFGNVANK